MYSLAVLSTIPEPELFTLNCPTQQILDVIGDKWSVIILYCLAYRPRHYGELKRKVEGISQKVLTQSLRRLERHGLIHRQTMPDNPPRTLYSLTDLGGTLIEPLFGLAVWSQTHFSEVVTHRATHDRRTAPRAKNPGESSVKNSSPTTGSQKSPS